ncbi:hypothetical protein ACXU4B_10805 [Dyella soli]|uniref:Uncharacterized protein n=1 Tax=Dyella soli TaxID=522319 RepID=A0A4R0YGM8_9GAMM|nr:hypothetical protein [Dyella soli]TCI07333.1 hypothetical protein EZM97_32615 [Dyella soli]
MSVLLGLALMMASDAAGPWRVVKPEEMPKAMHDLQVWRQRVTVASDHLAELPEADRAAALSVAISGTDDYVKDIYGKVGYRSRVDQWAAFHMSSVLMDQLADLADRLDYPTMAACHRLERDHLSEVAHSGKTTKTHCRAQVYDDAFSKAAESSFHGPERERIMQATAEWTRATNMVAYITADLGLPEANEPTDGPGEPNPQQESP